MIGGDFLFFFISSKRRALSEGRTAEGVLFINPAQYLYLLLLIPREICEIIKEIKMFTPAR